MSKSLQSYRVPHPDALSTRPTIPTIATTNFEMKPALINMVQQNQFGGYRTKDPTNHLQLFQQLCQTVKRAGVTPDQVNLMQLVFSLKDRAYKWVSDVEDTK